MLINELSSAFISLYEDWKAVLFNPIWFREGMSITWPGATSFRSPNSINNDDLEEYHKNKKYSFQLFDGSLLQMRYICSKSGESLSQAQLSFLQYVSIDTEEKYFYREDDANKGFDEFLISTTIESQQVETTYSNSWLRIDYDPDHSRGVIHSDSHLHVSLSPDIRIPVKGVPTPKQFVESIMAWFYPQIYEDRLLNKAGEYLNLKRIQKINKETLNSEGHALSNVILHLNMPELLLE